MNSGWGGQQSGYGAYGARQEVGLLAEQGVQVTTARFVVWQQTYPIAGLTSIAPFTVPAPRTGMIVGAVISGLLMLSAFVNGAIGGGLLLLLVAGGFALFAAMRKATHGVVVWTAGANIRALTSTDPAFVGRVVGALNQAIAMR